MKIVVDLEKCVGSGQCVMAAPELFDQRDDDGLVVVLNPRPEGAGEAAAREAAYACPALAIEIIED